ncbi:MAG: InlB B-repeat-containing protein [Oscillospiraceae bacterium]|jgi:uncharacterized repeat protein (TIGR02543 family)|nr:InlB B-repeat-containing protein [Oscillospiraceae bacterium]
MKTKATGIPAAGRALRRGLGFLLAALMLVSVLTVPGLAGGMAETEIKAGSAASAQFYAPETIYMKARGKVSQWFVTTQASGQVNAEANNKAGAISFSMEDATIKGLRYDVVGAKTKGGAAFTPEIRQLHMTGMFGAGTNNLANGVFTGNSRELWSGSRPKFPSDVAVTKVEMEDAMPDSAWLLIRWTVVYELVVDGVPTSNEAYAYSVLYQPSTAETGIMGYYKGNYNWIPLTQPEERTQYAFIAGIHGTMGGDRARRYTATMYPAIERFDSSFWYLNETHNGTYVGNVHWGVVDNNPTGITDAVFPGKANGGVVLSRREATLTNTIFTVNEKANIVDPQGTPSYMGTITVDSSRYKNLKDVPNLGVGYVLFWISEPDKKKSLEGITVKVGGATRTLATQTNLTSANDTTVVETHGLYPVNTLNSWNGQSESLIFETSTTHVYDAIGGADPELNVIQRTRLDVTAVDKSALRLAVRQAVAAPLNTGNAALSATLSALKAALDEATQVLGYPETDQAAINAVTETLLEATAATQKTIATASLITRAVGTALAPEAVYLRPGATNIYYVLTKDNLDQDLSNAGNAADAKLTFTVPGATFASAKKIGYYTLDKNGTPSSSILAANPTVGGVSVLPVNPNAYYDFNAMTAYPAGDQQTFSFNAQSATTEGAVVWVFSYTYQGVVYESYAVTYIHPTPLVQAGVATRVWTNTKQDWITPAADGIMDTYTFMTGVHTVAGGNRVSQFMDASGTKANPLRVDPNLSSNNGWGLNHYDGLSASGSVTQGNWGMKRDGSTANLLYVQNVRGSAITGTNYFANAPGGGVWVYGQGTNATLDLNDTNTGGDSKSKDFYDTEVNPANAGGIPRGILSVDMSRYTGYAQLPFLSVGVMMFDWDNSDDHPINGKIYHFREVEQTGGRAWMNNVNAIQFVNAHAQALSFLHNSWSGDYGYRTGSAGLLGPAQGAISSANGYAAGAVKSHLLCFEQEQRWEGDTAKGNGKYARTYFYLWLEANVINKATLRTNYFAAANQFRSKDLFVTENWEGYRNELVTAGLELGRVMQPSGKNAAQWQASIDAAASTLAVRRKGDGLGAVGTKAEEELVGVTGEEILDGDTVSAWNWLYVPGDNVNNEGVTKNDAAVVRSSSYVTHHKPNGELFYRDNVGTFATITEEEYNKLFPQYDANDEEIPGWRAWASGALYSPGQGGARGEVYFPGEFYLESIDGGAQVLHPLVTPSYLYDSNGNGLLSDETPVNAVPAYDSPVGAAAIVAWQRQWQGFRAAYPDGSYVVHNGKLLLLEVPSNLVENSPYMRGATVHVWAENPTGFLFNPTFYDEGTESLVYDGLVDVIRWGVDEDQAHLWDEVANPLYQGPALTTVADTELGTFSGAEKTSTAITDATPGVLDNALTFGRLRYDLYYQPVEMQYKYTSIGVNGLTDATPNTGGGTVSPEDYFGGAIDVAYYSAITVTSSPYPDEDVPFGKHFTGWLFSGDNRVYQAGEQFVWLTLTDEVLEFTPVFGDDFIRVTIDGNGGTFSMKNGSPYPFYLHPDFTNENSATAVGTKNIVRYIAEGVPYEGTPITGLKVDPTPGVEDGRRGYNFTGWSLEDTDTGSAITPAEAIAYEGKNTKYAGEAQLNIGSKDTTIKANWYPKTYKVQYMSQGALFLEEQVSYDQAYDVTGTVPTAPVGHRFVNWTMTQLGPMASFLDSEGVLHTVSDGDWADAYASYKTEWQVEYAKDQNLTSAWTFDHGLGEKMVFVANFEALTMPVLYDNTGTLTDADYSTGATGALTPAEDLDFTAANYATPVAPPAHPSGNVFVGYGLRLERNTLDGNGWVVVGSHYDAYHPLGSDMLIWEAGAGATYNLLGLDAVTHGDGTYRVVAVAFYGAQTPSFTLAIDLSLTDPDLPAGNSFTYQDIQSFGVPQQAAASFGGTNTEFYLADVSVGENLFNAGLPVTPTINGQYGQWKWRWAAKNELGADGKPIPIASGTLQRLSRTYELDKIPQDGTDYVILYIDWAPVSSNFYLQYDPNGGTFVDGAEPWVDTDNAITRGNPSILGNVSSAEEPNRTGYTFDGWQLLNADGDVIDGTGDDSDPGYTIQDAEEVTTDVLDSGIMGVYEDEDTGTLYPYLPLVAKWIPVAGGVTVEVDLKGGAMAADGNYAGLGNYQRTVTAGNNYGTFSAYNSVGDIFTGVGVFPSENPSKAGYDFAGWVITGGAATGAVSASVTIVPTAATVTVEATYTPKTPTGPEDEDSAQLLYHLDGTYASFAAPPTSDEGFAAQVVASDADAMYKPGDNTPVYRLPVKAGAALGGAVTTATPIRPGFLFQGWFTGPDGSGGAVTVASPATTTDATDPTMHIYAKWMSESDPENPGTEQFATINFHPNGGIPSPIASWTDVEIGGAYGALPTVTRPGYTATGGWHTRAQSSPSGDRQVTAASIVEPEGSAPYVIDLYRWWTAVDPEVDPTNAAKVVFHLNATTTIDAANTYANPYYATAGTTKYSEVENPVGTPITAAKLDPSDVRPGYAFLQWRVGTKSAFNATGKIVGANDVVNPDVDGDASDNYVIHVYAVWGESAGSITINRDTNGAPAMTPLANKQPHQGLNKEPDLIDLGVPVWAGHTFLGWGSGSASGADVASYSGTTLTGAKTLSDLIDIQYTSVLDTNSVTVYAKWQTPNPEDPNNQIKLVFDAENGSRPGNGVGDFATLTDGTNADEAFVTVTASSVLTGTPPTTARVGYTWDGKWYDGDGAEVDWGDPIEADDPADTNVPAERRVYAVWTDSANPNATSVYWNPNGGVFPDGSTNSKVSGSLTAGNPFSTITDKPAAPTRAGYTGTDWYDAATGGNAITGATIITPVDLDGAAVQTVYYQWEAIEDALRIEFDFNGGVLASNTTLAGRDPIENVTAGALYSTLAPGFDVDDDDYLVRAGYQFAGWRLESADGVPVLSGDAINPAVDAVAEDGVWVVTLVAKWDIYTTTEDGDKLIVVTWDPNGGNPAAQGDWLQQYYNAGDSLGNLDGLSAYTRPGYRLTFWLSEDLLPAADWAAGVATAGLAGKTVEPTPGMQAVDGKYPVAIQANWEAIDPEDPQDGQPVVVRFNANGGTTDDLPPDTEVMAGEDYGTYFDLDAADNGEGRDVSPYTERGGYHFLGWYLEGTTTLVGNDDAIDPGLESHIIVLVAQWGNEDKDPPTDPEDPEQPGITNGMEVVYAVNGGTAMANAPATAGTTFTAALAPLTVAENASVTERTGFTLVGWYLDSGFTTASKVVVGTTVLACDPLSGDTVTVYAKWVADGDITVTLGFDARGGTAVVETRLVTAGAQYGSLPVAPIRKGYSFLGWYTSAAADVAAGATASQAGRIQPTDTIEPEDFRPEGFAQDDEAITLTLFARWKALSLDEWTEANGLKVVFTAEPYTNSTSVITPYYVMKVVAGEPFGTNETIPGGARNQALPTANLGDGYVFENWYYVPDEAPLYASQGINDPVTASTTVDTSLLEDPEEDTITLYAHLERSLKGVVITLHADAYDPNAAGRQRDPSASMDGTDAVSITIRNTQEQSYYCTNSLMAEPFLSTFAPTRTGYRFTGWYDAPEGTEGRKLITAEDYIVLGSPRSLYCGWAAITPITVTLEAAAGLTDVTIDPAEKNVTFDAKYGALPVPVKSGYKFDGWLDAEGEPVDANTVVRNPAAHTLYAQMSPNVDIVVTFDPQGGSVSPASKVVSFEQPYGAIPTPSRQGYHFVGWWYSPDGADGEGAWVTPEAIVEVPENHTVYAIWSAQSDLIVIFDPAGGVVLPHFKQVTFDAPYGDLPIPVRLGYKFLGWYTDDKGGTLVTAESLVKIPASHVLYARWKLAVIIIPLPVIVLPPVILPIVIPPICVDLDGDKGDGITPDPAPPVPDPDGDANGDDGGISVVPDEGSLFPDTGAVSGFGFVVALAMSGLAVLALGKKRRKEDAEELV